MSSLFDFPDLQSIQRQMGDVAESRVAGLFGRTIPAGAVRFFEKGFTQAPAYGLANQVVICQHTVPVDWECLILGLVAQYAGPAPRPLPGDCIFTLDVDTPLGSLGEGYSEKDLGSLFVPVGSFELGPAWPIEYYHTENETIRLKGYTVANVATGANTALMGALLGYQWPSGGVRRGRLAESGGGRSSF